MNEIKRPPGQNFFCSLSPSCKITYSEYIILIRIRSIGLKISMLYLLTLIVFTVAPVEWVKIQVLTDDQNESDFKTDCLTD